MIRRLLVFILVIALLGTGVTLGLVFRNNGTYKVVKTTFTILGVETVYEAKNYDTFDSFHKAVFDKQIVIDRKFITLKANANDNAKVCRFSRDGKEIIFTNGDINFNTYKFHKMRIRETFDHLGITYVVEYKR